jgi:hypothetical protein
MKEMNETTSSTRKLPMNRRIVNMSKVDLVQSRRGLLGRHREEAPSIQSISVHGIAAYAQPLHGWCRGPTNAGPRHQ